MRRHIEWSLLWHPTEWPGWAFWLAEALLFLFALAALFYWLAPLPPQYQPGNLLDSAPAWGETDEEYRRRKRDEKEWEKRWQEAKRAGEEAHERERERNRQKDRDYEEQKKKAKEGK